MIAQIFRAFKPNSIVSIGKKSYSTTSRVSEIYGAARKCIVADEKGGFMVKSPYQSMTLPPTTIDRHVWSNISKWPNHVAIECGFTGRKYTYSKLRDHSAALAIRLRRNLALQQNDLVAISLPNVPEYAIAVLGALEAGLCVTTINPSGTAAELSHQLSDSKPKLIFCSADRCVEMERIARAANLGNVKIVAMKTTLNESYSANCIHFDELIDTSGLSLGDSAKFNDDADFSGAVILPYSSGTTGLQKGVLHTHSSTIANSEVLSAKMFDKPIVARATADFQEVIPCFLPFYHIYGLTVLLLNKLSLGCKIISMTNYQPNTLLDILRQHKVTFLPLVPPVLVHLNNFEAANPTQFKSVRTIMCGASNLVEKDAERFLAKNAPNCTFIHGYGMTEGVLTFSPSETQNYASVGWPLSRTDIKIAKVDDPNFQGLPAYEVGELLARGPTIMTGYFNNEEATKRTLVDGGWIRTGDIAYYDENGLFYICDRLKELIKVNANQVAPAELEGILREHADVAEAVVIGVPHEQCGEVPKAFIVRRLGSSGNEREITEFVARRVSKYKQLTGGVQFVDTIPKSASGKILRREIKRLYC